MNFHPYHKIHENFAHLQLDPKDMKKLDKVSWVVTEKIHGANFSVHLSENELFYAKRKEILQPTDDFFAFQLMVERLEKNFRNIYQILLNQYPSLQSCSIYGELFGGEYPHPEVQADNRIQAIQTGIYYSPNIEFCVFDIKIQKEEVNDFICYEEVVRVCKNANLLYANPLLIGKLTEAMSFDIRIDSQIPKLLRLPALPQRNLIEGIVIKPFQHLTISTSKGEIRPILKIKNPEFSEVEEYHLAQKWSFVPSKDELVEFFWAELQHFATKNRWNNILSKIGIPKMNDSSKISQIVELFMEDVLESFGETNGDFLSQFSSEQIMQLKRNLKNKAEWFSENTIYSK
jgi:Rnl2 family RNA ligase